MAVSVGYVRPMSGQAPPAEESTFERNQRLLQERGLRPPVTGTTGGADVLGSIGLTPPRSEQMGILGKGTNFMDVVNATQQAQMDTGRVPFASAGGPIDRDVYNARLLAQMFGGDSGGGAARPDFSGYRDALMGQADELNARIQAMYNQLAEQAGANVGRIQDIYGGAQTGVGDIYDSATGNIQQAFSSAQQQAADQLARLGIEAAAPAVVDPMALSQAQAVSGLETGRAGGLSALERYGSAASGFGSQMGQVAQQQGTEMNAAILASLQNRLAESLAAEQAGGGGGGGGRGMSLKDQMAFTDWANQQYDQNVLNIPSLERQKFDFAVAQSMADPVNKFLSEAQRRTIESLFPSGRNYDPETLIQSEVATREQLRQALGLG